MGADIDVSIGIGDARERCVELLGDLALAAGDILDELLRRAEIRLFERGIAVDVGKLVRDGVDVAALETEIALLSADQGRMAYLSNPKIRGLLKTTLKANGVPGYIWENNEVNGYPVYTSNLVPSNLTKGTSSEKCSVILFGDWSKLWIMSWGGLDITVDPYTMKKEGAYEVTLNAYHDIFVRRKEAFALIKDALTEEPAAAGGGVGG